VREDPLHLDVGEAFQLGGEGRKLGVGDADPAHPRIYLEMHPRPAPAGARGGLDLAERLQPVDHGGEVEIETGLRLSPQQAVQENDPRADLRIPERDPLLGDRHAQPPGAGPHQRPGAGDGAVSVGIRLHDRQHLSRAGRLAEGAEVPGEGIEVDLGARGSRLHHPSLPVGRRRQTRERAGGTTHAYHPPPAL
jgi:hypothetical protein